MEKLFVKLMADDIWDVVMRDGMPHRIKDEDGQKEWMLSRYDDLVSYNGGAAWDIAYARLQLMNSPLFHWYKNLVEEVESTEDSNRYDLLSTKIADIEENIKAKLEIFYNGISE